MSTRPRVVVLSDDLTGAVASAAEAVRGGGTAQVASWDEVPDSNMVDVLSLDTNSRLLPAKEAEERIRATIERVWASGSGQPLMYKRVDSQLRGNTAVEVRAWRQTLGVPALIAVAAPAYGFSTTNGRQHKAGVALQVKAEGQEARVHPIDLLASALLRRRPDVRSASFPERLLTDLTAGADILCDSEEVADLQLIAQAAASAQAAGTSLALIGSYGLLNAWLSAEQPLSLPSQQTQSGSLVVATSYQTATLEQVRLFMQDPRTELLHIDADSDTVRAQADAAHWLELGRNVLITTNLPDNQPAEPGHAAAKRAAAVAGEAVNQARPAGLVLLGGEGASSVMRALRGDYLEVISEPWPATPLAKLRGGPHDGLLAIVQSGSQGEPTRLLHAVELISAWHRRTMQPEFPIDYITRLKRSVECPT